MADLRRGLRTQGLDNGALGKNAWLHQRREAGIGTYAGVVRGRLANGPGKQLRHAGKLARGREAKSALGKGNQKLTRGFKGGRGGGVCLRRRLDTDRYSR